VRTSLQLGWNTEERSQDRQLSPEQFSDLHRSVNARRRPASHEPSPLCQGTDALFPRRFAHVLQDHVDSGSTGTPEYLVGERLCVVEYVLDTQRARLFRLFRRSHRSQHPASRQLSDLHGRAPHPAGGTENQHGLTRPQGGTSY
jgi:hypothetical protein